MRRAGGIVALIAGIFGLLAALLYVIFGIVLEHQALIQRAFYGGAFAFLMIAFASLSLSLSSRLPALLMIVTAVIAPLISPSDVLNFACMVFGVFGGLLAVIGRRPISAPQPRAPISSPEIAQLFRCFGGRD